jgi:putative transposase
VPVEDRTVVLSDNGAGYLSRHFGEYLRLVGIRHITASPYHPQTNGKIEGYHRSIKGEINLVPHDMPRELKEEIEEFIEYYNYHRYHELVADVTPYDVYTGRHLNVIHRPKEVKIRTLQARLHYDRSIREQANDL